MSGTSETSWNCWGLVVALHSLTSLELFPSVFSLQQDSQTSLTGVTSKEAEVEFARTLVASLVPLTVKKLLAVQETRVRFLEQKDPLEKGMATHSSILAWRIPWTGEPGGLRSTGSQNVRHN